MEILTRYKKHSNISVAKRLKIQYCIFLLFRVMEIHRICEVTATPEMEGAILSE